MMSGHEDLCMITNFHLAACFGRINTNRGGSCIFIKKGHLWKTIPKITTMSVSSSFECCAVELIDYKLIIVCVYRTPQANNLRIFFDSFDKTLNYINKTYKKHSIIIAGDFNINILRQSKVTLEFESLLLNYNMKLEFREPTRKISLTCIDNFAHKLTHKCKSSILELALSDHTAQLLRCNVKKICLIKQWRIKRRDYNSENMKKFNNCIKNLAFSDMYATEDPNLAFNNFHELFLLFYNLCFPFKLITIKAHKKQKWVSRGVKACSIKKRRLLWQYLKNPKNEDKKYELKQYSKLFKKIIKLTQRAQNIHSINTSNNKAKTAWKIINSAKQNTPRESINNIKVHDETLTDPKIICNAFNNYFIDKIVPNSLSNRAQYSLYVSSRLKSMFMKPCSPLDVWHIIRNIKNTKSVGYDGLCTEVIKYVATNICQHISYIINLCIEAGVFPDKLKTVIIKPLFKKESRDNMKNYRPIALVPILSKIFEKYIHRELNHYLESNCILVKEQKGFRCNKSINMAIYDFLQFVMRNVDNRVPVCSIYMDMTQAFDHVDHTILLGKLNAYGIRGNVLKLFESYLKNRIQYTEVTRINIVTRREEIHRSEPRNIHYGVPQGSVLGPLLFILYINDLPNVTVNPITLFADDSTISIKCKNKNTYEQDINNALSSAVNWLNVNNLKANVSKTTLMHFSQRTLAADALKVCVNNQTLKEVDYTKFLGILIDKKITWKPHIEQLCKRVSKSVYALHELAQIVDTNGLLIAYHGLVESVLRYGVIFWGNSVDKEIIFKSQKRCLRAMFSLQVTDSCQPYFRKYNIMTLPSIYIYEVAVFVKLNLHLFIFAVDRSSRAQRDKSRLCLCKANTTLMHKSVFAMAPKIFNKLPNNIKDLNLNLFKKQLKKLLIEKCYYNVYDYLSDKM